MAISVHTDIADPNKEVASQTDGNETIFKLERQKRYLFECINTSAGTATLKATNSRTEPTSFSGFLSDTTGAQSASFERYVGPGKEYAGLDAASGTWTVRRSEAPE